jgi:hypothetical protein
MRLFGANHEARTRRLCWGASYGTALSAGGSAPVLAMFAVILLARCENGKCRFEVFHSEQAEIPRNVDTAAHCKPG